ncbi:MAG: histidine kinase [Gammaproteobacteria bacterium]
MTLSGESQANRPSLKWRLLRLITGIVLLGLLFASASIVKNGREAIRAEGDSFAKFSVQMLRRALSVGAGDPFGRQQLDELIAGLNSMRHVWIVRVAAHIDPSTIDTLPTAPEAPGWFARLMMTGQEEFYRVVIDAGPQLGSLVVMTDPADEIDEVWADVYPLLWLAAGLVAVMWLLLYAAVRYSLAPLADLTAGLQRLERGDFSGRVREDVVLELHHIHRRFNWMSGVLRETMRDNRELAGRMVVLREEELLGLARELHDELSPYVFSIKMNIAAASNLAAAPGHAEVAARLQAIATTVAELEQGVRRLLRRLRPATLDELGLEAALHDLTTSWRDRLGDIEWTLETAGAIEDLDDTLKVTTYRVVQECMTNVVKHAAARKARIAVSVQTHRDAADTSAQLRICVEDDGTGMPVDGRPGFGLRGMGERVRALGGSLALQRAEQGGLRVKIEMPVNRTSPPSAQHLDRNAAARRVTTIGESRHAPPY